MLVTVELTNYRNTSDQNSKVDLQSFLLVSRQSKGEGVGDEHTSGVNLGD